MSSIDPARSAAAHEPGPAGDSGTAAADDAVGAAVPGAELSGALGAVEALAGALGEVLAGADDDGDTDAALSSPPEPQPVRAKMAPRANADTDEDFHGCMFIASPSRQRWAEAISPRQRHAK
ncbi:hypothetical protein QNO08_01525 [Arthrobacter sp. zg-Y820]|uniref:hypothetical protein n=1 Tax=unclassified Arthrobacter TaxID=235627 RepID=UPI0025426323|nr:MULTISPECIES: hypothetical protein [unclassified Arthrobacter]MCC9198331.1 hypothetical protein [Arthrobacter sp. zg-Y820]MDK1281201.1 hypothetical protein [Arthrobacter sp. zg.Y820]MDK1361491.1 hypothetical protein [Arthrobacter sp. zg-Y1219]WIB11224.1 hypothetical protein QNO08_01525 [Arthrobacter sp. zg-Y820]